MSLATGRRLAALGVAVALGCAGARQRPLVPSDAVIVDLTAGVCAGCEGHRDVRACSDFTLTEAQISLVLARSVPLTPQQLAQHFQWAPCVVRGHAVWDGRRAELEISAFLVTTLRLGDGIVRTLGCERACEDAVYAAEKK